MFFEGIRSERLLMRLVADRLSVRWYLGFNLHEPLPDHSSLTRIRTRYGVEVFHRFFEAIVEQCKQAGLVWGRELFIDGTQVQANAALASLSPRFAFEARDTLQEHLAALFPQEDAAEQPEEAIEEAWCQDAKPTPLPVELAEEVRHSLTGTNEARHDWLEHNGAKDRSLTSRGYQRTADLRVSTTDPDATPMHTHYGADLGYRTHYVVDGGKARVILAALVTPFEVTDNQPMLDLIWRVRFRWKVWPRQVTGDTRYGTTENIVGLEREGIHAYVPITDLTERTPFFRQEDFRYDAEQDVYVCPAGKELTFCQRQTTEESRRYRARAKDCNHCSLKARCTTSIQGRSLCRSVYEEYLDRVRAYHQTEAYKKAYRKRAVWVEPLFAEVKDWHGLWRFRLRRLWRVNCEALLIATGQNLKRLLSKHGWGRRPLPSEAAIHLPLAWLYARCLSNLITRTINQGPALPTAVKARVASYH